MSEEAAERTLSPWPPPGWTVPRMSDDELRAFVLGVLDGHIFTAAQIEPGQVEMLLGSVFMPIAFGGLSGLSKEQLDEIGTIYEHLNQAAPQSINGYPMFFSMKMIHAEDWQRAIVAIEAEQERRKNIQV